MSTNFLQSSTARGQLLTDGPHCELEPYSADDPRGFLRKVFKEGFDDRSDILSSVEKRLDLAVSKFNAAGGLSSMDKAIQHLKETSVFLHEMADMIQAYTDLAVFLEHGGAHTSEVGHTSRI